MAQFNKGNMWYSYEMVDLFLITTNATCDGQGHLVMGAGIAKQANLRHPGLPEIAGSYLLEHYGKEETFFKEYNLVPFLTGRLGLFQTKRAWWFASDVALVRRSIFKLQEFCDENPRLKICLNYPGIGYGRLKRDEIKPYLQRLPNTVHIWEYI